MAEYGSDGAGISILRDRLHEINHWWPESDAAHQPGRPGSIPAEKAWDFYQSDFIGAIKKLWWKDWTPQVFAIAGPENTGKTTLLSQMLRLFVDDDFRELLQTLPDDGDFADLAEGPLDLRAAWAIDKYQYFEDDEGLVAQLQELGPDRVLYLPLDADPSFQLRSEKQLRDAVEYYETEILDGDPDETKHYIFIDDVHTLSGESDQPSWGETVADLANATGERKVVLTTVSPESVEEELYDPERDRMRLDPDQYDVSSILPPKFLDYLQRRYPIFEGADVVDHTADFDYRGEIRGDVDEDARNPDNYRISGSPLRSGVREAVKNGDPAELQSNLDGFEAKLDDIYEWVGSGASDSPRAWIQNALDEYLLLGGYTSLGLDDALFEQSDNEFRAFLRGDRAVAGHTLATDLQSSLDGTLGSIHEQAPIFESIRQRKTRDLSRLFAWASHTLETEPFDYDELLNADGEADDWVLDVDRRTLREKYFETLDRMVLLTFSDGYGHKKPRELRVALRDVGLANALLWRDLDDVRDIGDLRARLEYMVAFDHVMRFSYNVNKYLDPNVGVVRYWQDGDDFVEFVPKVWGAPVPIGFDTSSDTPVSKIDAVGRFLDEQRADPDAEIHDFVRYEPTVGEPQTGPSGNLAKILDWFDEDVAAALEATDAVSDLSDLWSVSVDDLAAVEGIDAETARALTDAVELYDLLDDVRGIGPAKQETLWNPSEANQPSPEQPHWTVEALADADPATVAELSGFTELTAERVVEAARSRREREAGGEYDRRLDVLLQGNADSGWPGIDELGEDSTNEYRGRYEEYEWGDENGRTHHRIHDGEAPFGIVLTSGSSVDRYESPEEEKPIFTVPLWMFLTLA